MQAQRARVVTPEAVVLDVQTAGLGSRVLARGIDFAIQAGGIVVLSIVLAAAGSAAGFSSAVFVVLLVAFTLLVFGYPIIFESLWRGRTPGKASLGLRVVTRQGAPIRFRHALVRGLVGMVEVMALVPVGVLSMLVSSRDQRLGDMAAGTIVIRERAAVKMSTPVTFYPPPGLESYVESLDVGAMTSAEYETVRAFLIRAHEMVPLPRSNLAARLAGSLLNRLRQPVPGGVGPETWLLCVAYAYQRRHGTPLPPPSPQYPGYRPSPWGPQYPGYGPNPWGPPPPPPSYARGSPGTAGAGGYPYPAAPDASPGPRPDPNYHLRPIGPTSAQPDPGPPDLGPPDPVPPGDGGFAQPD